MGAYALIAIVAIIVYGILRFNRDDNQANQLDNHDREALFEAQRERDELRERVQVLERIVTDANSSDARKTQRLTEEIENLRRSEGKRQGKSTEDVSE
ncbi:MAG: hypothetical protein ABJ239_08355 [Erythrobacter sp.]